MLSLALLGCLPPSAPGATRSDKSPSEISSAEIEAALPRYRTAYELVHALRPRMLASREVVSQTHTPVRIGYATSGIKVYLDGLPHGGLESLSMIPASTVLDIARLSAMDATTRYGTGHTAGVIAVRSRAALR
jgi:hypothetical protein